MNQPRFVSRPILISGMSVIFAALLFFNCRGQNSGTESSKAGSADATTLQGEWSTGCIVDPGKEGFFIVDARSFSGKSYSTSFETFKDSSCEQILIAHAQEGEFSIENRETENDLDRLTMTAEKIFITIHNQSLNDAYNKEGVCGGNWEVGAKRQLEKSDCQPDAENNDDPDMIFDVFELSDGQLMFGNKENPTDSGSSEATRPTEINRRQVFLKQ